LGLGGWRCWLRGCPFPPPAPARFTAPQPTTRTPQTAQVNADLLAKGRGLRISEVTVRSEGAAVLSSMSVSLGASKAKFSAAKDPKTDRIYVEGTVRGGRPYLTKIGEGLGLGLGFFWGGGGGG